MRKCVAILCLALAALLPSAGCEKRKGAKPRLGEVERLPRVETVALGKPTKIEFTRSYTATVESFEKADLCAMVRGSIKEMLVDRGRHVKKGELLFTLHIPDLVADRDNKKALIDQAEKAEASAVQAIAVADAEIKEAEAAVLRYEGDVAFRGAQFVRINKLAQGDTLSRQQVDEAKLQLDSARAALAAAQAQVATKKNRLQAAHKDRQLAASRVQTARTEETRAQVQVDFASLRAPFDGVIGARYLDTGATIKDASVPILTILRTDKVRVILDVPERDVPYFRGEPQGNPATLEVSAAKTSGGTEKAFKVAGAIALTSDVLDPVTRTMRAEIHLDNKAGLLKSQMTGTAIVTLAVREAVMVPASSLLRAGNKTEIYIVADPAGDPVKGIVKRVEVQTGIDDGLRVEIRSDVLNSHERVIVRGAGMLRPGDTVIAVPMRGSE